MGRRWLYGMVAGAGLLLAGLAGAAQAAQVAPTVTHAAAAADPTYNVYITLYGWDDNSPPGCAIAYPQIHSCAGGVGTYSNPTTFATDSSEFAPGTIVYYAPLERYFIMEDDCVACDEDWTGQGPDGGPGFYHIDLWAGGAAGDNANALYACEDSLTPGAQVPVIVDPPSNEPVFNNGQGGSIFNPSNNTCNAGGSAPPPPPPPPTTGTDQPFGGTAAAIPGTVAAANYDTGGQGVAYNVSSVNGTANSYRSDGVDLEVCSDSGCGHDIGWTSGGQWFKYTVNVATAGTYTVSFQLASPSGVTDAFHLANSSGTNLTGSVNAPVTGGWQNWTTATANVTLPAGQQTLTLDEDNAGWNIYTMTFASSGTSTPPPSSSPPPSGTSAWAVGVSYTVGELVTYDGNTYKCLQANTSEVGWDPVDAPALWELVS